MYYGKKESSKNSGVIQKHTIHASLEIKELKIITQINNPLMCIIYTSQFPLCELPSDTNLK